MQYFRWTCLTQLKILLIGLLKLIRQILLVQFVLFYGQGTWDLLSSAGVSSEESTLGTVSSRYSCISLFDDYLSIENCLIYFIENNNIVISFRHCSNLLIKYYHFIILSTVYYFIYYFRIRLIMMMNLNLLVNC